MKTTIVINPNIRFGKPTIVNTRITVEEVLGALAGGMGFNDIEKEYGLTNEQILSVIKYVAGWIKGEETKNYAISS